MAYGFNFAGLFGQFGGELRVARIITGIVSYQVTTFGPQGYAIRSINRIRSRFGISQTEAAALFRDVRDNIEAARRVQNLGQEDLINPESFPYSPNVLGDQESTGKFVYSGYVELVDEDGDRLRRVPWVVEGDENSTLEDLLDDIGQSAQGFVEKYEEEMEEGLHGGGIFVGKIQITFVAKR